MTEIQNSKQYDLEERTLKYAIQIRNFIKILPKTISNIEDCKQLVRSSGSIGANYIEANEALGKKDFLMRIRICRKEAKETVYWLKIINANNQANEIDFKIKQLIQEADELKRIFSAIIGKSK